MTEDTTASPLKLGPDTYAIRCDIGDLKELKDKPIESYSLEDTNTLIRLCGGAYASAELVHVHERTVRRWTKGHKKAPWSALEVLRLKLADLYGNDVGASR